MKQELENAPQGIFGLNSELDGGEATKNSHHEQPVLTETQPLRYLLELGHHAGGALLDTVDSRMHRTRQSGTTRDLAAEFG
ncbi:MAG: hypothetical protein ACLQKA_07615 [Bryobacteraceae bacterium]